MIKIELRRNWGVQEYIRLAAAIALAIYAVVTGDLWLAIFSLLFLIQAIFSLKSCNCKEDHNGGCCQHGAQKEDSHPLKEEVDYEEVK